MSKANDPFEEYLRKKKVELLETKFRNEDGGATVDEVADGDYVPPSNDDPELEARVQEEVEDFFESGVDAGAKLFNKAGTGIENEKVEEIRDALDDVFEEDAAQPQTEGDDGHTFVDFFRQVRDEYDGGAPADETAPEFAGELESRPETDAVVEVEARAAAAADAKNESAPDTATIDDDFAATAAEVSEDELVAVEVPVDPVTSRLSLNDILTPPENDDELRQRVELLGRLVAKLVERAKLPENEIIEVLIRSGVEF